MELEAALSEAEGALEQEENKVLRAQLELTQVQSFIYRYYAIHIVYRTADIYIYALTKMRESRYQLFGTQI